MITSCEINGSYPLFVDRDFRFLQNFVTVPDMFYYYDEFGRIQGMFSSEFEAVVAKIFQSFGLINEFFEGTNLHVKTNYGLKTIDFMIVYLNSNNRLCRLLVEAHPWTKIQLRNNQSNFYIDWKKFESISRPELNGLRYYFIESPEDLYKLIYRFNDHLEMSIYDEKIYGCRGEEILNFRQKYLKFKIVSTEHRYMHNTDNYEDLSNVVEKGKFYRSKAISELSYMDFLEYFEECKSSIIDAKIERKKRVNPPQVNYVKDFVKINPAKTEKYYKYHYHEFRIESEKVVKELWCLVLVFLACGWVSTNPQTCNILLLLYKKFFVIFSRYNYFCYILEKLQKKFNAKYFDEIFVRKAVSMAYKIDNKERCKQWLVKKARILHSLKMVSDNLFQQFLERVNYY